MSDKIQDFLSLYEKNAANAALAGESNANAKDFTSLVPAIDEANDSFAGESDFDPNEELVQKEEKPNKIDTSALLMGLDYGADSPSDDEKYCAYSFLEGKIGIDDLDDAILPHMVAAISHTVFGSKNDFTGDIIGNSLRFYNPVKNEYETGYDKENKTWDTRTLLTKTKEAWDVIRDETGQKRQAVLNRDVEANGLNRGNRKFYSNEISIGQLDYMYDIASENIGAWERFQALDDASAAMMPSREGFDFGAKGWFGIKSIPKHIWDEGKRAVNLALNSLTSDSDEEKIRGLKDNMTWHYAINGDIDGEFDESDKYALDCLAETIGVKKGDYAALEERIRNAKGGFLRLTKDDKTYASFAVPNGLGYRQDGTGTCIMIDSGNEIYEKMNVINRFKEMNHDTTGVVRLADTMGILGSDPKAVEGVAIYTAGRKENKDILGFITDSDGDEEGLRNWANEYMNNATSEEDAKKRFNTIQTAFYAIQSLMSQPAGVLPESTSWWSEWGAGGMNIALNFGSGVKNFVGGTSSQVAYKIERMIDNIQRMIDNIRGESPENAEKAHREHMFKQQIRNLSAWDIHDDGTVAGWLGEQVVGFKAFELVFAARASAVLSKVKAPWAQNTAKWLTKSRAERVGRIKAKADDIAKAAENIEAAADDLMRAGAPLPDSMAYAEQSINMIEKAEALALAGKRGVDLMTKLVGSQRSAQILEYWRGLLDRTPGLFMVHESSIDDMERAAASKYADIMVKKGDGFDESMWTEAQDIIQGRAVVSTGFMMNLGNFFKKLKAGSVGNAEASNAIVALEKDFVAACKAGNANVVKAHLLGLRIGFGECVLKEARNMFKLGFGMGTTGTLGENLQDIAVGVKPANEWGDDVLQHGIEEGASMGLTLAFMRSLRGSKTYLDAATKNVVLYKTIAQQQRPENIISSILARNKNVDTGLDSDARRKHGESIFVERLVDYFDRMNEADEALRNKNVKEWRDENRRVCGEEGAKMFDAFVADMKYAPQAIDFNLQRLGQRVTAKDIETTLKTGGIDAKAETLDTGDIAVDLSFDMGGKRVTSKLLVHNGTIFVQDGEAFKPSFALDVVKNITEGNASKSLIDRYNALSDAEKRALEVEGKDVDGILTDAMKEMSSRGLFFSKEDAIEAKKAGEKNLVNIETPELYNGIVILANGKPIEGAATDKATIRDFRHEVFGHAIIDALKQSGILTDADITSLKTHFGNDAKWEERFSETIADAIAKGDDKAFQTLLPEQRNLITKVRDGARSLLRAMHIIKENRGPEATFSVDAFMKDTLEKANETVKLKAERDKTAELVRASREQAAREAREALEARRRELEATILEENRRNKEIGHERAVQIAKSRDEVTKIANEIARLGESAKSFDEFLGKVEKAKGDFIKALKRLGFDKDEVGKYIENWFLKEMDSVGDTLINRLESERIAAEAKAKADDLEAENKLWRERARKQWLETERKLQEDAARKAKDEYKSRLESERQRIQAKAESKKAGEEFAKQLSISVSAAEQTGYDIYKNLLEIDSVKKFDRANKTLLRRFDSLTKGFPVEVVKPHRDALKREMYEARKKMELKADAIKARAEHEKAELAKQREAERIARQKEKEAKKKVAEAKAKKAKEEAAKAKEGAFEIEKVVEEAIKKREKETKSQKARKTKEVQQAELQIKGFELMDKRLPIPNRCVIAGLKGEQLTRKRALLRQSNYYYDKETDSWVTKKSAPKTFKRAATKTVEKTINNIVNAKVAAGLKKLGPEYAEYFMGIINGMNGADGEVSDGSDTSKTEVKKPTKAKKDKEVKAKTAKAEQPKSRELTAEEKQRLEAFTVISQMIRSQGVQMGWTKEVIEQKLREVSQLDLTIDPTTNQISIKGKAEQPVENIPAEENKTESAPKPNEIPSNKTLREEKKWWTKQLTAEERLGLAIIEVLGKPWCVAYCAGEVIQGGETLRIAGANLPEGAVVRPFSAAAAEKALDAMAERKRNEGIIEAELRTKPFFNAEWKIADRKVRIETMARNGKDRAEKEKAEKELAEYNEIMELESRIKYLEKEKISIDAHIVEKKKTVEELETLGLHQLASLPPEYTKEEANNLKSNLDAQIKEIEATLAKKRMPTHADGVDKGKEIAAEVKEGGGHFSISNIYTGSPFDYANRSRLGGMDDGPSLKKIGTGEGAYTYGWGLYGTNRKGIANSYAKAGKSQKESLTFDNKEWDENAGDWGLNSIMYSYLWSKEYGTDFGANLKSQYETYRRTIDEIKKEGEKHSEYAFREKYLDAASKTEEAAKDPAKTLERIKELSPSEYIYEQTFFTNRAKGDESHLMNWYEPISKDNLKRINDRLREEYTNPIEGDNHTGASVYKQLSDRLGGPKEASMFLVRADIDGVKYPADSHGRTPQDGNKVGWNYVSFRDDNIRVDNKWIDGELQHDSGKMMVAYRQGVERLFMREFDVVQDRAKELVDEMMSDFLFGTAYESAKAIATSDDFDQRSSIPNWMLNEHIELSHNKKGYEVTLPSKIKFFIRKGGFGGDNFAKFKNAKDSKDINGLHAEVQIEFADGKAKMPYGFKNAIEADENRVLADRAESAEKTKKIKEELKNKGVSETMLGRLEKVGAFPKSNAQLEVMYTVADFFPDSKQLESLYPDTYQNTRVIIRGSEAAKSLKTEKGKPVAEPLFKEGQFANLDAEGNIIVDMSTPEKRVRIGESRFENAVLRDITACVIKKIRREEGFDDDTARSAEYLTKVLDVKGRDKKTGASTKFKIYEDKTLKDILSQAIRRRFAKRALIGMKSSEEEIKRVIDACDIELTKILDNCFNDFITEREAIMFANRFGMSTRELSDSFGKAQKGAHEGAIISPFDKRFTTRQKSDTYAQYYRQVLRKIDAMVSVGAGDHKARSLEKEFDQLLDEFMRYEYRKNARSRGGEIYSVSPELQAILGFSNGGMNMADKTAAQSKGEGKGFENVVIDNRLTPAESVIATEELAAKEAKEQKKAQAKAEAEAMNTPAEGDVLTPAQRKSMDAIDEKIMSNFASLASGRNRDKYAKEIVKLFGELEKLIKDVNPKFSDKKVKSLMEQAKGFYAAKATNSPLKRVGKDGKQEDIPIGSIVTDGKMSVRGSDFESNLVAAYASKIAWTKSRRRTKDTSEIADEMTEKVVDDLLSMGIPAADAKRLATDFLADSKVIADSIVGKLDETATESQVIAEARTKAARQKIGNNIYRSFQRGHKIGTEGIEAHDRAERIVERQKMRAIRRAIGYTTAELNSALGIDLIKDLVNIGRDGFKYGTARDLSLDLTRRAVNAFRMDNAEMKNATDGEIMADPVFRAEFAATVSSWLVEAAKSLSYGRERELAIRDAMRVRVTLPPTLRELQHTIEHHAEMLGKDLGRMNVEQTLGEIDKLIDSRAKITDDGEIVAGASGAKKVSETDSVYKRTIEPRLQSYWKYVKEAMRFNKDKVDAEIERISSLLEASDTDIAELKTTAPSGLKADSLEHKDVLRMKLSALYRYGALIEKSPAEVLDAYYNDIAVDIAYAAERFLVERKRREEENNEVVNDFVNEIDVLLKNKKGFEDVSKMRQVARGYFMWNVPDMFAKFNAHFKTDSKPHNHMENLRRKISLAHEEHMRLSSIRIGEVIKATEEIYGVPFADFIQTACVPDAKYSRFSRSGWVVPEKDGPTFEHWTGKYYQHDMPKIGKKKGDKIYETIKLAVPQGNPLHTDKTKSDTKLALLNLVYIYAASRQKDMEVDNIIYGRDAAYIKDLENTIGTQGIMLADRIAGVFDIIRQDISPVSEYITGMPVRSPDKFYVPLCFEQDKTSDRTTRYSVNPVPKFLTARKFHDGARLKEDTNILELATRRIQDAYHYKAFGVLADTVKHQLADKRVVTMYHKLLGNKTASSLFEQLNETFNGGTAIEHQGGVGIRNFITATALGFNPANSMKQLEGIGGWGLGMKPTEWLKLVLWDKWFNAEARDGIRILHETGFFEKKKNLFGGDSFQRSEGFSEPMLLLMHARESGGYTKAMNAYSKTKEWYKSHMLDFMKFFDRVATDFGAGTYYASRKNFYKFSKHMSDADAHSMALADTDYMIQIGQASGRPEFMHEWQRRGTTGKLLTHFVGPTLVRAGIEIETLHRHFMVERNKKSFNALASKLFASHVVCPAMLTMATQLANYLFGERDDKNASVWDDFTENLLVSSLLGPMSGVLIMGQIADGTLRTIANRDSAKNSGWRRRYEIPLTSKLNALAFGLMNISKDAIDITECLLEGAEVNDAMIRNIQEDSWNLLKQGVPATRFINLGVNMVNDYNNFIDEKEKK